jgi:hypothetical protein
VAVVCLRRLVSVVSPCTLPSTMCLYADTYGLCSTCSDGICLCLNTLAIFLAREAAAAVVVFEVVADVLPPIVTILGDGELGVTSSGVNIMNEYLLIGSEWSDAGATSLDERDGNLTPSLSVRGGTLVDTAVASAAGAPHLVTYTSTDTSDNTAVARRRVYVFNPCKGQETGDERPCLSDTSLCTVTGANGVAALAVVGGVKVVCECSINGLCSNAQITLEEEVVVAPVAPTITLVRVPDTNHHQPLPEKSQSRRQSRYDGETSPTHQHSCVSRFSPRWVYFLSSGWHLTSAWVVRSPFAGGIRESACAHRGFRKIRPVYKKHAQ